jgi:hypothetical protein
LPLSILRTISIPSSAEGPSRGEAAKLDAIISPLLLMSELFILIMLAFECVALIKLLWLLSKLMHCKYSADFGVFLEKTSSLLLRSKIPIDPFTRFFLSSELVLLMTMLRCMLELHLVSLRPKRLPALSLLQRLIPKLLLIVGLGGMGSTFAFMFVSQLRATGIGGNPSRVLEAWEFAFFLSVFWLFLLWPLELCKIQEWSGLLVLPLLLRSMLLALIIFVLSLHLISGVQLRLDEGWRGIFDVLGFILLSVLLVLGIWTVNGGVGVLPLSIALLVSRFSNSVWSS